MNCVMPCDLRSNPANIIMGNELSHLCVELPMHIEGNIPVLWSFNDSMKRVKENGDYAAMYLFTHITYLLFPVCLGMLFRVKKKSTRSILLFLLSANKLVARVYNSASLWLTTLAAGTSTALATMSICNRDISSLICLSPSVGSASINFCVTSYADEIRLAVVADPDIVPDPKFLTESFIQQVRIHRVALLHKLKATIVSSI